MFFPAIAEFFKHKVVGSIIVLVCWSSFDNMNLAKKFSEHGVKVTISCDPAILDNVPTHQFQGVLYIKQKKYDMLNKVKSVHFANWYKWLLISDDNALNGHTIRYDADITILKEENQNKNNILDNASKQYVAQTPESIVLFEDIYVHPRDGASSHQWAYWSVTSGFKVTHNQDRTQRRQNLHKYPFRIAAPFGHYSEKTYNGTFGEYLVDFTVHDSGLRCGYGASSLLIEAIKATEVLVPVQFWVSEKENSSLIVALNSDAAEVGAGALRIMRSRLKYLDYVMPIWILNVGFTYLADRESSSNMYVEPFTAAVWWSCLIVGLVLAVAQRVASRKRREKDGAYIAVLATCLQQDADAVPEGITGRWTFTVLSICSMLVHAYYTSAIVSGLMSAGRGGPKTLRALGDSRYAIASEDHDFIRQSMFNVKTNWSDLEYLKQKKMTSKFYQDIKKGVQLMQQGDTAYHAEYHQVYHHLNILSDDDVCKMQHVDTVPATMTYLSSTIRGQWTNTLRVASAWLYETGLAKRLISQIQVHPPPCRVALLAEKVNFWDVAPLVALTTLGAVASLVLLGLEILFSKYRSPGKKIEKNPTLEDHADLLTIE